MPEGTATAAAIGLLLALGPASAGAVGSGNNLLPDIPQGAESVELELVVDVGAVVTDIANAADGSGRLFIVSPDGVIRIFVNGSLLPTPFLNAPASPPDRAMSALAFHPDYATNGKLYVITGEAIPNPSTPDYFPPQTNTGSAFDNVLVEYTVDPNDADRADPASRRELLRVRQPHRLHNLDDLVFGHDGLLYISSGDGGDTRTGSPTHYNTNAPLTTNPYGKILRIDVAGSEPNLPYAIPPGNPFASGAGGNVREILAWGLRNPWRLSTDRASGQIHTGSNGDFTIEQIYRVEAGRDYGWDSNEGSFQWNSASGAATVDPTPDPNQTLPLAEYDHNGAQAFGSVIGGYVYRGSEQPALYGRYVFVDRVAEELASMHPASGALELIAQEPGGVPLGDQVITFGEDEDGELYIGLGTGEVLGFVPVFTAPVPALSRGALLLLAAFLAASLGAAHWARRIMPATARKR